MRAIISLPPHFLFLSLSLSLSLCYRTQKFTGVRRFAPAAPRELAAASRLRFGGLGLRRRPLALGLLNAQRYQTNNAR
jgi:hypothetical protein